MIRLLLCSKDPTVQSALAPIGGPDFSLTTDSDQERVKHQILNRKCDVVIVDFQRRCATEQFRFLEELRVLGAGAVIVLTDDSRNNMMDLARKNVRNCCMKPLDIAEVRVVARRAHQHAALQEAMEDCPPDSMHQSDCGELVGSSAGAGVVYDMIRRVANLNVSVLITGESGTGKELIARAIHSTGSRARHPFIAVSCGAIPDSLIEAEFFGAEKGAYTGSSSRRTGYFEDAGDGTLLLDEIGELNHHTQVKLLRVLQQREFMRLGSSIAVPLRARVLFATNRDLKKMVAEGTFREDLYYRLNVVSIHSVPLRERPDDIPQLAQHFIRKYAALYQKNVTCIAPDSAALLRDYRWPGNIRELENAVQSAIVLSDGEMIGIASLPADIRQDRPAATSPDAFQWSSFEEQLRDYKTKLAFDAVKECNGNKTLAAQTLNISRTYLHRLIREPGDEGPALQVA